MNKKEKLWNPKVSSCSECPNLKPLKDKKSGTVDPLKDLCEKFNWEIDRELGKKQAICKVSKTEQRRKRKAGRS